VLGDDIELTCHDGTVRDLVFMQDATSRSSLLVSGGAGDCKICITDCETGSLVRSMAGHAGKQDSSAIIRLIELVRSLAIHVPVFDNNTTCD